MSEFCHHCGKPPEADGDHTCSCPLSDSECLEHTLNPVAPETTWRQVWSVVYDSDNPSMDGPVPLRMAEQDRKIAERNLALLRSSYTPKRNLRLETRFVTEWLPANDEADR
jgi:hypothetical protein